MLGVVWGSWLADLHTIRQRTPEASPWTWFCSGLFPLFARCRRMVPFLVPALGVRRLGQENKHSWCGFRCQQQRRLGTAFGATTTATTTVGRRSGYPCRLPRSAVLARTSQTIGFTTRLPTITRSRSGRPTAQCIVVRVGQLLKTDVCHN